MRYGSAALNDAPSSDGFQRYDVSDELLCDLVEVRQEQNKSDPGEVNPTCSQNHDKRPTAMDHHGRPFRNSNYSSAILGSNQ